MPACTHLSNEIHSNQEIWGMSLPGMPHKSAIKKAHKMGLRYLTTIIYTNDQLMFYMQ
jgi:hypothetical protein